MSWSVCASVSPHSSISSPSMFTSVTVHSLESRPRASAVLRAHFTKTRCISYTSSRSSELLLLRRHECTSRRLVRLVEPERGDDLTLLLFGEQVPHGRDGSLDRLLPRRHDDQGPTLAVQVAEDAGLGPAGRVAGGYAHCDRQSATSRRSPPSSSSGVMCAAVAARSRVV